MQQGKYPRTDNKLDMTAHTFMVFAVHSTLLLADLVPAEHIDSVYWRSWLLHHQILCMVLAAEFTLEEVRPHSSLYHNYHSLKPLVNVLRSSSLTSRYILITRCSSIFQNTMICGFQSFTLSNSSQFIYCSLARLVYIWLSCLRQRMVFTRVQESNATSKTHY